MFRTNKKIFNANCIIKRVKTKVSYCRPRLLQNDSTKTCICGLTYISNQASTLSNYKIIKNISLTQQNANTFDKNSERHFSSGEKIRQKNVIDKYEFNVTEKLIEAIPKELSNIEIIQLLDLANFVDAKDINKEFIKSYYKVLEKLKKGHVMYNKYFKCYYQLKELMSESSQNDNSKNEKFKKIIEEIEVIHEKNSRGENEFYDSFYMKNNDIKLESILGRVKDVQENEYMPYNIYEEFRYATTNRVPERVLLSLVTKAQSVDVNQINRTFFLLYYKILQKLNYIQRPDYEKLKLNFDKKVINAIELGVEPKKVISFLSTYASFVGKNKEIPTKEMIAKVVNHIKANESSNLAIDERFSILKSLNQVKYDDIEYFESMTNLVKEHPELLEESLERIITFVKGLGLCDFPNRRKKHWPDLRKLISGLNVLQDANEWKATDFQHHFNIVKFLALWDIYPEPLLTSLSERCNPVRLSEVSPYLQRDMLNINQAVHTFYPSFNKPFLTEYTLSRIHDMFEASTKHNRALYFNQNFKKRLECEIKKNDCVLANCFTRQGLFIDLVMALNEKNQLFTFSNVGDSSGKIYIEDIELPKDFQLITLDFIRNPVWMIERYINLSVRLKLKCLQAMGCETVPIFWSDWKDKGSQLAPLIWKIIRDRTYCRLSEFLLVQAKEQPGLDFTQEPDFNIISTEKSNEIENELDCSYLKSKDKKLGLIIEKATNVVKTENTVYDFCERYQEEIENATQSQLVELLTKAQRVDLNQINSRFFQYYYIILQELDYTKGLDYEKLKLEFENKIINAIELDTEPENFRGFLQSYAVHLAGGEENYSEELITKIMHHINKNQSSLESIHDKFCILKSLTNLRHYDADYVESMRNLVIKNPDLLEDSTMYFKIFVKALAIFDFPNKKKKYWPYLRRFISELHILKDASKWNEKSLTELKVIEILALWGIYPEPLLTLLWQKCNNGILTQNFGNLSSMISINQVVHTLCPSFKKKPFLNESTLSMFNDKLENFSINKKVKYFNQKLKTDLEYEISKSDCILANCFTKQGLRIDLVMALNEENELYTFPNDGDSSEKIYIEDISLPDSFQLIILLLQGSHRHDDIISIRMQLNMKCLQAMGCKTVPLVRAAWNEPSNPQRASLIWKMILDKNDCRISESLLERAREPSMFE